MLVLGWTGWLSTPIEFGEEDDLQVKKTKMRDEIHTLELDMLEIGRENMCVRY